jgi:hypothetical protein
MLSDDNLHTAGAYRFNEVMTFNLSSRVSALI